MVTRSSLSSFSCRQLENCSQSEELWIGKDWRIYAVFHDALPITTNVFQTYSIAIWWHFLVCDNFTKELGLSFFFLLLFLTLSNIVLIYMSGPYCSQQDYCFRKFYLLLLVFFLIMWSIAESHVRSYGCTNVWLPSMTGLPNIFSWHSRTVGCVQS